MDKREAIKIVENCAKQYESELNGRSLLIIYLESGTKANYLELVFRDEQFMHLTGLKSHGLLSAKRFYQKCLNNKLQANEFDFSPDGTSEIKLKTLPYILCKNLHANAVGDFNGSTIKLVTDKIVGNQRAFMGFINIYKDYFIPNTLIKGDIRDYAQKTNRIIAVFRKFQNDSAYNEITYVAKNIDWDKVIFSEACNYLLLQIKESEAHTQLIVKKLISK